MTSAAQSRLGILRVESEKKTCWNCTKRNIPFHPYGPTCKQITLLLQWFPTYFPENKSNISWCWWQVCSSCRFGPMCQLGSGALEYLGMEHVWRGHMQIRIDSKALVWLVTHCLAHVPATAIQRVRLNGIHCLQGLHTSPSSNSHNPNLHPAVSSFRKSAWIESNIPNSHCLDQLVVLPDICEVDVLRLHEGSGLGLHNGSHGRSNNRCTFRMFRVKARIPRCGVWKPRNSAGHWGPTPKAPWPLQRIYPCSMRNSDSRSCWFLAKFVTTLWFVLHIVLKGHILAHWTKM